MDRYATPLGSLLNGYSDNVHSENLQMAGSELPSVLTVKAFQIGTELSFRSPQSLDLAKSCTSHQNMIYPNSLPFLNLFFTARVFVASLGFPSCSDWGLPCSCGARLRNAVAVCCRAQDLSLKGFSCGGLGLWSVDSVVVAHGLAVSWHVGPSWTRDQTHIPCLGRRLNPGPPGSPQSSVSNSYPPPISSSLASRISPAWLQRAGSSLTSIYFPKGLLCLGTAWAIRSHKIWSSGALKGLGHNWFPSPVSQRGRRCSGPRLTFLIMTAYGEGQIAAPDMGSSYGWRVSDSGSRATIPRPLRHHSGMGGWFCGCLLSFISSGTRYHSHHSMFV